MPLYSYCYLLVFWLRCISHQYTPLTLHQNHNHNRHNAAITLKCWLYPIQAGIRWGSNIMMLAIPAIPLGLKSLLISPLYPIYYIAILSPQYGGGIWCFDDLGVASSYRKTPYLRYVLVFTGKSSPETMVNLPSKKGGFRWKFSHHPILWSISVIPPNHVFFKASDLVEFLLLRLCFSLCVFLVDFGAFAAYGAVENKNQTIAKLRASDFGKCVIYQVI